MCDMPLCGQDVTQQHLCDPLTVSLIEKCTRFHIHCAHFMCEEPLSSFDAKINNENMTKCLQSLKEMYQDLRSKGVLCASEAEFQGYNVLLSLNKGDILRYVYRPWSEPGCLERQGLNRIQPSGFVGETALCSLWCGMLG